MTMDPLKKFEKKYDFGDGYEGLTVPPKYQKKKYDAGDELFEEINITTTKEEALKQLQEIEEKLNIEEKDELSSTFVQNCFRKMRLDISRSHNQAEKLNEPEKSTEKSTLKEENENEEKTEDKQKKYVKVNTVKSDNFIRANTCYNGFKKNGYRNDLPYHSKQNYFERGHRRGQRGARIGSRVGSYRGRYKPVNRDRETFYDKREIENINLNVGFKREKPKENKEEKLANHQSVLELLPSTVEEESDMLREAIELSKQQLFVDRLQQKQLEKLLKNDAQTAEQLPCAPPKHQERNETRSSSYGNTKNFSVHESDRRGKLQKQSYKEISENGNRYSDNSYNSRKPRSVNTYPLNNKSRNNSVTPNYQRQSNKNFEDNKISSRLFINSIRSIKQSNETNVSNTSSVKTSTDAQNKYSRQTASSEGIKSTPKDERNLDWNSIASNDLKTMLHIGNKDTKINVREDIKYTNDSASNITSNSKSGDYQSARHEKEIKYDHRNDKYKEQRNCSYHFQKYNPDYSHKRGSTQRMRNNQRHYGERGGDDDHRTYSKGKELEWRPYSKQVEEGRFDNVPPRFKRMYK